MAEMRRDRRSYWKSCCGATGPDGRGAAAGNEQQMAPPPPDMPMPPDMGGAGHGTCRGQPNREGRQCRHATGRQLQPPGLRNQMIDPNSAVRPGAGRRY